MGWFGHERLELKEVNTSHARPGKVQCNHFPTLTKKSFLHVFFCCPCMYRSTSVLSQGTSYTALFLLLQCCYCYQSSTWFYNHYHRSMPNTNHSLDKGSYMYMCVHRGLHVFQVDQLSFITVKQVCQCSVVPWPHEIHAISDTIILLIVKQLKAEAVEEHKSKPLLTHSRTNKVTMLHWVSSV